MREREVDIAAADVEVDGVDLGEGRLRVLVFLLELVFEVVVVVVVVASGILSACILRRCWTKRSLRLKSLKSASGLGFRRLVLLPFLVLWLLLRVLVCGGHRSQRQKSRWKCWDAACRFHSFFALKEAVQP